jgi:hypothetical protein
VFNPHAAFSIVFLIHANCAIFTAQTKMSALFVAAQAGHADVVATLLDAKADINSQRSVSITRFVTLF